MGWFYEFNEETTLKDVRDLFADEARCKKFIETYREKRVGLFDAVAAFLLGGAKNSTPCTANYCKCAFNKNPSTWGQNLAVWTGGNRNKQKEVNEFCAKFKEENSLKTVYERMDQWTGWGDNDKKTLVLSLLSGSVLSGSQSGIPGGKDMDKIKKNINEIISKAIQENKQVIFTGAPGTGKTWSVREYVKNQCATDDTQYKFVQFHPSYDYSDFVEGLRPVVIKGKEEPTCVRMDGVFKEFCRHIVEKDDKEKNYYFIVDEINRADLAKVFGELMFGLEESYRGKDNPIQTQYKNLVTYRIIKEGDDNKKGDDNIGKAVAIENDVFKDGFYIPENLYFIGTMNDIDRSVDSMDFALRRRFQWIDVKANEIMESSLHSILDKDNSDENSDKYKRISELAEKVINMNNIISADDNRFGLSEAYHIGPAYFKNLDISSDENLKSKLESKFDTNITSILREYTRGRKSGAVDEWIGKCRKALLGED